MKLDIEIDADDIKKLWFAAHVATLNAFEDRFEVVKDFGFIIPDEQKLFFMFIDGESNYLQALVVYHYYKKREVAAAIFWDLDDYGAWVVATSDRDEINWFDDS